MLFFFVQVKDGGKWWKSGIVSFGQNQLEPRTERTKNQCTCLKLTFGWKQLMNSNLLC